jgi:uncharacterized glyoxalase superfamily protein PhnB
MRTYKDAKAMAKSLRDSMAARNVSLSHGECLEIVAQQFGFADWGAYAQISRSQVTIHLDANSRSNTEVFIRMKGLDALHRELSGKSGVFSPTEISFTPWDSRVFAVADPFGNKLRFWENNPPGVARPIQRAERLLGTADRDHFDE